MRYAFDVSGKNLDPFCLIDPGKDRAKPFARLKQDWSSSGDSRAWTGEGFMSNCSSVFTPVLAALFVLGCSTTLVARRPLSEAALAEVNTAIAGRNARVMATGVAEAGPLGRKDVKVTASTTEWLERPSAADPWRPRSVPTAALWMIAVRQPGRGALEGLGLGLLAGAVVGAIVGGAGSRGEIPGPVGGGIGVGVGAFTGLLIGAVLGGGIGHRKTVEFESPEVAAGPPEDIVILEGGKQMVGYVVSDDPGAALVLEDAGCVERRIPRALVKKIWRRTRPDHWSTPCSTQRAAVADQSSGIEVGPPKADEPPPTKEDEPPARTVVIPRNRREDPP